MVLSVGCAADTGNPPNIILIMTDDQGWTSVSYRSDPEIPQSKSDYIETPQMERMAREGMRFTDAYAPNPICHRPATACCLARTPPATFTPGIWIGSRRRPDG